MIQRTRSSGGDNAILEAASQWGPGYEAIAESLLGDPDGRVNGILQAASRQTMVVPDGRGGVREESPNTLGPVLVHLRNKDSAESQK